MHSIHVPDTPALSIEGLTIACGDAELARDVSLSVAPGEVVGLLGESGSGKSMTAFASLGLLPRAMRITHGQIRLAGIDVTGFDETEFRRVRTIVGAIVFQEPLTALNPTLTIARQMTDLLRQRGGLDRQGASKRARELLADMLIDDPARVLAAYPFQLSGGMRQRVLIAMALACDPALLIADEITTALDVTVQTQILSLLATRVRERGVGILFISHDLALVSGLCDRIYVMYAGRIVEFGTTATVIAAPLHPYTRMLLGSLPDRAPHKQKLPVGESRADAGAVARADDGGCVFRDRCPERFEACDQQPPERPSIAAPMHRARCWRVPDQAEQ